jgi:uncharacterized protein DUF4397
MRVSRIGLACIGALLAVGCSESDGPFFAPEVPLAYTRFINAIPDTGAIDFRFVDLVEYSPFAVQLAYRGFTPYQGTATGARHLKVFTNPGGSNTLIQHVTNVVLEESPTFEAGKYYTLVAVGYSRTTGTPRVKLQVYEDPIPDPGTQVAFRVVNLATGLSSLDVSLTSTSTDAIPATPNVADNLAYLATSAYLTRAPGSAWFRVQESTSATEIVTGNGRQAPAGAAGDPLNNLTTIGGSGQAGSAVTAWIFPRTVAGSTAPNVTTPSIIFTVDKHPR